MSKRVFGVAVLVVALAAVAQAETFTWSGAPSADWVTPANWTPAGAGTFVNDAAHATDVCHINAGGVAKDTAASFVPTTFYPQLNVNAGATLDIGGYHGDTVNDLQLNGGAVTLGSASSLSGAVTVTGTSALSVTGANNDNLNASVSGTGDLDISCVSGNTLKINGNNSAYSGKWTFKGGGGYTEMTTAPGTGVLRFEVGNVRISVDTSIPWELDTNGGKVTVTRQYNARTHTGQFTLESDAILDAATDGYGKKGTINGQVTGVGRLTTRARVALVLGSGLNDYSGGTRVDTAVLEAMATGSLGLGNVQVDPGADLKVFATDTMNPAADLYLDFDGASSYGQIDLGVGGTVTTVTGFYVGGLGGWDAPAGYTPYGAGDYTSASPGMGNYLNGSGTLHVLGSGAPIPEPAGLGLIGMALLGLRRRRS